MGIPAFARVAQRLLFERGMFKRLASLIILVSACTPPVTQGGNNQNDRSNGGEQGEELLTGAMIVSPQGDFLIAQRNQTSVLVDIEQETARELPEQVDRFVFAKTNDRGIAVLRDQKSLVAYNLQTLEEIWRTTVTFTGSQGATLLRLSDDDKYLILGDEERLMMLDAELGEMQGDVELNTPATELSFVPGSARALVVGSTRWIDHKPDTEVVDLDIPTRSLKRISIPNCAAPIVVMPDKSRAFLSPTFCQEATTSTNNSGWTNPDPVSVIDLLAEGPHFVKNLPGFGPVALDPAGARAVAYLDVQRMDESMFEDPSKVPARDGARYHIMTIDPKSLQYNLAAVGNVLPRFVLSKNGKALLVDATVQLLRGDASVKATLDSSGRLTVKVNLFGQSESLFGLFDLDAQSYTAFSGPAASLDRFVQLGDETHVYTLKTRFDGMGGDLYRIDIDTKAATSLGKSLRDIGLLADGKTLVLRERLPAVQVQTEVGVDWYRRERYCFSLDGTTCLKSIEFQDSKPFQSGPSCTDYHDC